MPMLAIGGNLSIHYQIYHPKGRPSVLLLHGLGANGESWGYQIPALVEAGYRVLAPDARGFGKSTFPGGKNSIEIMAEDMTALLMHLQSAPSDIVGISMGGTLALQIAIHHPELVNKLVLVNTFASLRPVQPRLWWHFLVRFLMMHLSGMDAQANLVANNLFPRPEQAELRDILRQQINQANPKAYRSAVRSLGLFNVQNNLGDIRAPTLVITGENDGTVPWEIQQVMADRIPNAKQIIIPHSGHAVIADRPEEFNARLLEFLAE